MPLSKQECNWIRNEREIVVLHVKETKSLIWLIFYLLVAWILCQSVCIQVNVSQAIRREIEKQDIPARLNHIEELSKEATRR